jgi:hypothetical protein
MLWQQIAMGWSTSLGSKVPANPIYATASARAKEGDPPQILEKNEATGVWVLTRTRTALMKSVFSSSSAVEVFHKSTGAKESFGVNSRVANLQ